MSAEEIAEALVSSCNHGDVATLQQLLSTYPDLDINYATEGGVTLLMHAIIGAGTRFCVIVNSLSFIISK